MQRTTRCDLYPVKRDSAVGVLDDDLLAAIEAPGGGARRWRMAAGPDTRPLSSFLLDLHRRSHELGDRAMQRVEHDAQHARIPSSWSKALNWTSRGPTLKRASSRARLARARGTRGEVRGLAARVDRDLAAPVEQLAQPRAAALHP